MSPERAGGWLFAALIAGCAGVPERSEPLAEAEAMVRAAATTPTVHDYAAQEISAAQGALRRARAAPTLQEMNHQAYLAAQQARIAMQLAAQRSALAQMKLLEAQRDRLAQLLSERALLPAEGELAALEAVRTARGYVVTLDAAAFEAGEARLGAQGEREMDALASYLARHPKSEVRIEGLGEGGTALIAERARVVGDALAARGEAPAAITLRADGEEPGERVEVIILPVASEQ